MNYKKIGLKSGIEVHQQLSTKHKLFCNCESHLSNEKAVGKVNRKLRPVAGETGEVDIAALHEVLRNKEFEYDVYPEETCLVETDSEPPHPLNQEALEVALQIAKMLNCDVPDEIHVMRKTVIDGSNTSGFQRTAIVGLDGCMETSFGKVGITNVLLEEDACQIIKKEKNRVEYGLDRLAIPLVEVGTSPDAHHPDQVKEVSEKLGMILRSTGKVLRGLGTIRQDINVSIKGGSRVEIKGTQDLRSIPKIVDNEILRQQETIKKGKKVISEVRRVKPDFKTEFMRPMPGAQRLYPETDIPPIKIDKKFLDGIKIPKLISDKVSGLEKRHKIPKDMANQLVKAGKQQFFEDITKLGFEPKLVFRALTAMVKDLEITNDLILEVFKKSPKNISKEALSTALENAAKTGKIQKIKAGLPDSDLRKIIQKVIAKNKDALGKHNPIGILMGQVMKEVRGKADGKKVAQILREEIGD